MDLTNTQNTLTSTSIPDQPSVNWTPPETAVSLSSGWVTPTQYENIPPLYRPRSEWIDNQLSVIDTQARNVVDDAFAQNNLISNTIDYFSTPNFEPDPNDDPMADWDKFKDYPEIYDSIIESKSRGEREFIIKKYLNEQKAQENINREGLLGVGLSLGASLADPTILLPWTKLGTAGKIGMVLGEATVHESMLSLNQESRTRDDAIQNIALGTVLFGGTQALGAQIGKRLNLNMTSDRLTNEVLGYASDTANIEARSVGAAATPMANRLSVMTDDETIPRMNNVMKTLGYFTPSINLITSDKSSVRRITNELLDHALELKGNASGKVFNSVESTIKSRTADYLGPIKRTLNENYLKFRQTNVGSKMSLDDFSALVMRHAIVADNTIPEVIASAKPIVKMIDDIDSELVGISGRSAPGNILSAIHNPVLYRTQFIKGNSDAVIADLTHKLENHWNKLSPDKIDEIINNMETTSLKQAAINYASEMTRKITYDGDSFGTIKGVINPLTKMDVADYLISYPLEFSKRFVQKHVPHIELDRKFNTKNFDEIINPIHDEYAQLIARNPSKNFELENEKTQVIKQIQEVFDNLTNQHSFTKTSLDTALNNGMKLAQASSLGSAVASSIVDIAKVVSVNGITSVLKRPLEAMIDRSDIAKLSRQEIKLLSTTLEDVLHSGTNSLAGIVNKYTRDGLVTKAIDKVSNISMTASGLPLWTKTMKYMTAMEFRDKVLKVSTKLVNGEQPNKNDLIKLAKVGLDSDTLKNIGVQYQTHGNKNLLSIEKWSPDTAQYFKEGLVKFVDKTINTAGAGDMPALLKHPLGRIFFQFQQYAYLNWNQFVLPGIQRADSEVLQGLATLAGLSYIQLLVKEQLSGAKVPEHWDGMDGVAAKLVEESGMLSAVLMGYDKTAGLVPGYSRQELFNQQKGTHRVQKSFGERVMESTPVGGYAANVAKSLSPIGTNEVYDNDNLKATRAILPLQNVWWLRGVLNYVEEQTAKGLDINNYKKRKDIISQTLSDKL